MQNHPAFNVNASVNFSRRQILAWSTAAIGCYGVGTAAGQTPPNSTTTPNRSRLLVRPSDIQELQTRNKLVLELEGKLQVNEPDKASKRKNRDAEVKAKSTVDYYELVALEGSGKVLAAARDFQLAEAEHWVAGNTSQSKLRDQCKQTFVVNHASQWQQFCQVEPMLVSEVELLLTPINTQVIELLLPETPAKINQPWTISNESARELFNLEAVHQSTLVASIVKVEEGVASIELEGEIQGTANSVSTELKIKGNFQAKLASQCTRLFPGWV